MSLATDPQSAIELRLLAQNWLASRHPDAVIVTELSVANWGGASVDIAAITDSHIIGVEIKGTGDSPTRLDRQHLAYGMVVREMWLLPCPTIRDRCFAKRPPGWGRLEVWNGEVRPGNLAATLGPKEKAKTGWRYPTVRDDSRYEPDLATIAGHLTPSAMTGTLWKDELSTIAQRNGIEGVTKSSYTHVLAEAIEGQMPAPLLHAEMIRELRARAWRKDVIDLRTEIGRSIASGHLVVD